MPNASFIDLSQDYPRLARYKRYEHPPLRRKSKFGRKAKSYTTVVSQSLKSNLNQRLASLNGNFQASRKPLGVLPTPPNNEVCDKVAEAAYEHCSSY